MGFPVREIGIRLPKWLASLDNDHYLKSRYSVLYARLLKILTVWAI